MRSKRHLILYMAVAVVAAALVACGAQGRVSKGVEPKSEQSTTVVADYLPNVAFKVKRASQMLDAEAQRAYYAEHFWDEFDFADSTFVAQVDNTLMIQTLLTAVTLSSTPETAPEYLTKLMRQTVVSKPVIPILVVLALVRSCSTTQTHLCETMNFTFLYSAWHWIRDCSMNMSVCPMRAICT